ncbi:MAG: type II secretion system protein [Candidatus Moraniibacteriota bacterium]|nr:MAG: type II secretion system protein [Candidatus Moranbacteria bacterium]
MRSPKAFTLPEVLIVIGILAILAVIVILAVDPVARFENARDARRLSDTQAMTSALHQYVIDHKGVFPDGLDATERQIGTARSGCALTTRQCAVQGDQDCLDLTSALTPYLHGIPSDPKNGNDGLTHYSVRVGPDNALLVEACDLSE